LVGCAPVEPKAKHPLPPVDAPVVALPPVTSPVVVPVPLAVPEVVVDVDDAAKPAVVEALVAPPEVELVLVADEPSDALVPLDVPDSVSACVHPSAVAESTKSARLDGRRQGRIAH
jgi:hypothetical protein